MKKLIASAGAVAFATISLFIFTIVSTAHAQITACPAGYVCTPVSAFSNPATSSASSTQATTCPTPGMNLAVGSQDTSANNAAVTCLQNFLAAQGYLRHVATGYFGPLTLVAVKAFQSVSGVPSTGYFGPLTRLAVQHSISAVGTITPSTAAGTSPGLQNHLMVPIFGGGSISVSSGTSNSGSSNSNSSSGCAAGLILFNNSCVTPTNPSISLTKAPLASVSGSNNAGTSTASTTFNITIQTSNTGVYAGTQSSSTPLLYFAVVDGNGNKIYDSNLSNNVTSVFAPNSVTSSLSVPAGATTANVSANSFLIPSQTAVAVSDATVVFPGRDKNGTALTAGPYTVALSGINYSLASSGSATVSAPSIQTNGQSDGSSATASLDSSSISATAQANTNGTATKVPLLTFDIVATNAPLHIHSLAVTIATTTGSVGSITKVYLYSGDWLHMASTTVVNGTAQFGPISDATLGAGIPANTSKPYTILIDATGIIDGNSLEATASLDTSSNTQLYNQNDAVVSLSGSANGNIQTILNADVLPSSISATLGLPIIVNSTTVGYNVSFSFTLSTVNDTLFVSTNPAIALATTSTGLGAASSSLPLAGVVANPGSLSGDAAGYYIIPNGSSRQFTYNGSINNTNGSPGLKTFSITSIKFGTTTSNLIGHNYSATTSSNSGSSISSLKINATF